MSILLDPNFDASVAIPSVFWDVDCFDGPGGGPKNSQVVFRPKMGLAGSNAVDLVASGGTIDDLTAIRSTKRMELNAGWYEFQIRYRTLGSAGDGHRGFYVGAKRYVDQTGPDNTLTLDGPFVLPRSELDWAVARIPALFVNNPLVHLWTFVIEFFEAPVQDDLRIDFFDVTFTGSAPLISNIVVNPS